MEILTKIAQSDEDFLEAKKLILEYVEWLDTDLSFQNFDKEMDTLQEMYNNPNGGLFVAYKNNKPVGVAGLRRFSDKECEVKRMFVKPNNRGFGIGKLLLTECVKLSIKLNYEVIKLDTDDYMKSAIKLYTDNGFVEIPAYRYNPHETARYFELNLRQKLLNEKRLTIREICVNELPLLENFLYEAVFQPEGTETPLPQNIIKIPEIDVYIRDFGKLNDDYCLVADLKGEIIGAVWIRILAGKSKVKGYGNIDEQTPEFAISLSKEYRNHGIGTLLMQKMLAYLKETADFLNISYKKVNTLQGAL